MKTTHTLLGVTMLALAACQTPVETEKKETSYTVKVTNPLAEGREAVMINIDANELPDLGDSAVYVVMDGETEIASQWNKKDKAESGLVFVLDMLEGSASKELTITLDNSGKAHQYTKRTQAELSHKINGEWQEREYMGGTFKNVDSLRVPKEHTDHSWFIRYEGPGWESDKVGYRRYLDWRNGTDVFGKQVSEMVLQDVGQDGFDSYHHLSDWGMDVLKVGPTLGLGTVSVFHDEAANRIDSAETMTCKILENGPVYSSLQSNYDQWLVAGNKVDLESQLSIHAGTRATHQKVKVKGDVENIATGIINDDKATFYEEKGGANSFGYLASFGKQSLNKDNLGLAVLFNPQYLAEFTQDEHSKVIVLNPNNGEVDYYFLAAWELEKEGITTEDEFLAYVKKMAAELAKPVDVSVTKN